MPDSVPKDSVAPPLNGLDSRFAQKCQLLLIDLKLENSEARRLLGELGENFSNPTITNLFRRNLRIRQDVLSAIIESEETFKISFTQRMQGTKIELSEILLNELKTVNDSSSHGISGTPRQNMLPRHSELTRCLELLSDLPTEELSKSSLWLDQHQQEMFPVVNLIFTACIEPFKELHALLHRARSRVWQDLTFDIRATAARLAEEQAAVEQMIETDDRRLSFLLGIKAGNVSLVDGNQDAASAIERMLRAAERGTAINSPTPHMFNSPVAEVFPAKEITLPTAEHITLTTLRPEAIAVFEDYELADSELFDTYRSEYEQIKGNSRVLFERRQAVNRDITEKLATYFWQLLKGHRNKTFRTRLAEYKQQHFNVVRILECFENDIPLDDGLFHEAMAVSSPFPWIVTTDVSK